MNIKKRWKNLVLVFCMTIAMVANTVTAHASALPTPDGTEVATVIDFVEYCQKHGLQYADDAAAKVVAIEDAKAKFKVMSTASQTAVKKSIGKGLAQGASILGYAFTSAAVLDGVLTLGAYALENVYQLDEYIAMKSISAIDNVYGEGTEYYTIHTDVWQARSLSAIEDLIGKRVSDEWVINSGLASKTNVSLELLNNMTEAQAEFYAEYLTQYKLIDMNIGNLTYTTLYVPPKADAIYVTYDGSKIYICSGYRLLSGYVDSTDKGYLYTYSYGSVCAGPSVLDSYSFGFTDIFEYDFHGIPIYQLAQNSPLPNTVGNTTPIADPITVPLPDIEPVADPKTNVQSYIVPSTDAEYEEALNNDAVMDNYIDSSGTDGGDGDGTNDDGDMPKLPYVGDGTLDISDGIKGALYFVRDCFSRIWSEMSETGSVAIVAVPLTLGVVAMIIGLGMKRGGK